MEFVFTKIFIIRIKESQIIPNLQAVSKSDKIITNARIKPVSNLDKLIIYGGELTKSFITTIKESQSLSYLTSVSISGKILFFMR